MGTVKKGKSPEKGTPDENNYALIPTWGNIVDGTRSLLPSEEEEKFPSRRHAKHFVQLKEQRQSPGTTCSHQVFLLRLRCSFLTLCEIVLLIVSNWTDFTISRKENNTMKRIDTIEQANKSIKSGWIAGAIVSGLSFVILVWQNFGPWFLADSIVLTCLTIGVYMKYRVAAYALLVYFIAGKLILWIRLNIGVPMIGTHALTSLIIIVGIVAAMVDGARGCSVYHRLIHHQEQEKSQSL